MSTATGKLLEVRNLTTHAEKSLLKPDPHLENALKNSDANGLPPITIAPLQGQFLALQCKLMGAKTVLEIGTLGGYSTIWFARTGASVTSIEIDPKHRDVALKNTEGLDVDIILGAALDVMPKLVEEGRKYDFVFVDASWEEQFEYVKLATKLTRKGGAIYVDNVVREVFQGGDVEGRETLVTRVGELAGVTATLISTVSGHKGNPEDMVDGFILASVN